MLSKNQIKLIKSLEAKKNRRREGLFVAEGPKVVGDLLRAGYKPHSIFNNGQWKMDNGQWTMFNVTDDELHRISFLQHPQQVLAVFRIPSFSGEEYSLTSHLSPLTSQLQSPLASQLCLALDGVQDPGNLGTIIRIADWFGIEHIFCSQDTADVYNPKVVQATMGSLAHVQITYCDLVALLSQANVPVYGTLLDGENIYEQPLSEQGIIVMGNEGNGISAEVRQLVTHKLLIPNFNHNHETAESLNVAIATAITCSEFRRRS